MRNYEVKKGDTLWKIGRKHGFTVQQLADLNKLKGKQIHRIREGQNLLLPDEQGGTPDTKLSIQFRGLDHRPFTPAKVKVQHDDKVIEREMDEDGFLSLGIFDHARGLKVWIEDLKKEFVEVLDRPILPVGEWKLSIDSRQVAAKGNLAPKKGPAASTAPALKEATTHNAQLANGETARAQTRVEAGKPVHAVASIYTEENLRLLPGNEPYRKYIIAAAKKYGMTPQSLAALIDAEAAKEKGVWQEKSNSTKPTKAQGLAQFFEPAWMDVSQFSKSLLHERCRGLSKTALLGKRLEAEYAIDSAAAYAFLNLKNFSRRLGKDISGLAPEDKAKVAYLLHHEGLGGALRVAGKSPPWTKREALQRLTDQFNGKTARAQEWVQRFNGDSVSAYNAWLYSYTDSKINVSNFLVKDKQAFATQPRGLADIVKELSGASPAPKPAPRAAPQPSPAQPKPASGDSRWHDPLDKCTLRTAGLASVRSAKFGMTRDGGTRPHQGIDLIAAPGTPVYAVADGIVYLHRARSSKEDYGDTLILVVNVDDLPEPQASAFRKVNPGKQTIGFFYAHLSEFCVKGGMVSSGEIIAKSGSSGNARKMTTIQTGAHLHFEVRKSALGASPQGLSNRVDPLLFLPNCTNK